jgi:hypothetical protein
MKLIIQSTLAFLFALASTGSAQIPGFVQKWSVDLGMTNGAKVLAVGRDGAVLVQSLISVANTYDWISPTGEFIARIPESEFIPYGSSGSIDFVVVLVLRSNLVIQSRASITGNFYTNRMQIAQCSRSGGTVQIAKTQLLVTPGDSTVDAPRFLLHDFSCPERLMFVQQGGVLACYRPAVDMTNIFTSLAVGNVSQNSAQLLVTSSQGGQLQLQGSTNLNTWLPLTNVQMNPGVNTVIVPALDSSRSFYRGLSQ